VILGILTSFLSGAVASERVGSHDYEILLKDDSLDVASAEEHKSMKSLYVSEDDETIKVGDVITMGLYNGYLLEWVVLEINDQGEALIVCRNMIDQKAYNSKDPEIIISSKEASTEYTWPYSALRMWLNSNETSVQYVGYPPVEGGCKFPYADEKGFLTYFTEGERSIIIEKENKSYVHKLDDDQVDGGIKSLEQVPISGTLDEFPDLYQDVYYLKTNDLVFIPGYDDLVQYEALMSDYLETGQFWLRDMSGQGNLNPLMAKVDENRISITDSIYWFYFIYSNGLMPMMKIDIGQYHQIEHSAIEEIQLDPIPNIDISELVEITGINRLRQTYVSESEGSKYISYEGGIESQGDFVLKLKNTVYNLEIATNTFNNDWKPIEGQMVVRKEDLDITNHRARIVVRYSTDTSEYNRYIIYVDLPKPVEIPKDYFWLPGESGRTNVELGEGTFVLEHMGQHFFRNVNQVGNIYRISERGRVSYLTQRSSRQGIRANELFSMGNHLIFDDITDDDDYLLVLYNLRSEERFEIRFESSISIWTIYENKILLFYEGWLQELDMASGELSKISRDIKGTALGMDKGVFYYHDKGQVYAFDLESHDTHLFRNLNEDVILSYKKDDTIDRVIKPRIIHDGYIYYLVSGFGYKKDYLIKETLNQTDQQLVLKNIMNIRFDSDKGALKFIVDFNESYFSTDVKEVYDKNKYFGNLIDIYERVDEAACLEVIKGVSEEELNKKILPYSRDFLRAYNGQSRYTFILEETASGLNYLDLVPMIKDDSKGDIKILGEDYLRYQSSGNPNYLLKYNLLTKEKTIVADFDYYVKNIRIKDDPIGQIYSFFGHRQYYNKEGVLLQTPVLNGQHNQDYRFISSQGISSYMSFHDVFSIDDRNVYYYSEEGDFYRYDLKTSKDQRIIEGSINVLDVDQDHVYYVDSDVNFYRYSISTGVNTLIHAKFINEYSIIPKYFIEGDLIYYFKDEDNKYSDIGRLFSLDMTTGLETQISKGTDSYGGKILVTSEAIYTYKNPYLHAMFWGMPSYRGEGPYAYERVNFQDISESVTSYKEAYTKSEMEIIDSFQQITRVDGYFVYGDFVYYEARGDVYQYIRRDEDLYGSKFMNLVELDQDTYETDLSSYGRFVTESPSDKAVFSNVKIKANGQLLTFDNPPVIIDGRTLAPVRKIFEAFGLQVGWQGDERIVTGESDDASVWLQIDNQLAFVNDAKVVLDVPGFIIDGRTYVPVRFIAESLGIKVGWDQATSTVILEK